MKELVTQKGTFIVVPYPENKWYVELDNDRAEIIGPVSDILKDEMKAKKVVEDFKRQYLNYNSKSSYDFGFIFKKATDSFQSLCTKYELKESDLLIKKL